MSQKLILPIPKMQITAGYKNQKYRQEWGFGHYGVDCIHTDKKREVYALGDGEVVACGMDGSMLTGSKSRLGNCIVIAYPNVQCNNGLVTDLACRMFHFGEIKCKPGDKIKAGDVIGIYGNTGANTSGAHLHIEFDTDVEYPQHGYGIKAGGNIIKLGKKPIDSTVNPSSVWFRRKDQTITAYGKGWTSEADTAIPTLGEAADTETAKLRAALIEARKIINAALEG